MASGGQGFGLGFGQVEQLHLDGVDLAGEVSRIDALDAGGYDRELLCVKHTGWLQALPPRSSRLVVDACAAAVSGGGVADGALRGG